MIEEVECASGLARNPFRSLPRILQSSWELPGLKGPKGAAEPGGEPDAAKLRGIQGMAAGGGEGSGRKPPTLNLLVEDVGCEGRRRGV